MVSLVWAGWSSVQPRELTSHCCRSHQRRSTRVRADVVGFSIESIGMYWRLSRGRQIASFRCSAMLNAKFAREYVRNTKSKHCARYSHNSTPYIFNAFAHQEPQCTMAMRRAAVRARASDGNEEEAGRTESPRAAATSRMLALVETSDVGGYNYISGRWPSSAARRR